MIYKAIQFVIRFRYLFMAGAAITALSGAWVHGFFKGKSYGEVKVITKIIEADKEVRRNTDEVRIEEQSLDSVGVDRELCDLGIVRGNTGCNQLP